MFNGLGPNAYLALVLCSNILAFVGGFSLCVFCREALGVVWLDENHWVKRLGAEEEKAKEDKR